MWLAYAGVSSVVALGYARFVTRLPRARFITLFTTGAALTYAVLRVLIGLEIRAAYAVFYVWSDVIANLTAVAIWTLANDLYDARSAKKSFGILGLGQVLGTVVCGFSTGRVVSALGTENLLIVLVGVLLCIGALASTLASKHPPIPTHRADTESTGRQEEPVLRSRYVATMAAMTLLLFVALTVGEPEIKLILTILVLSASDLNHSSQQEQSNDGDIRLLRPDEGTGTTPVFIVSRAELFSASTTGRWFLSTSGSTTGTPISGRTSTTTIRLICGT